MVIRKVLAMDDLWEEDQLEALVAKNDEDAVFSDAI